MGFWMISGVLLVIFQLRLQLPIISTRRDKRGS
jgi:hypothetical protein